MAAVQSKSVVTVARNRSGAPPKPTKTALQPRSSSGTGKPGPLGEQNVFDGKTHSVGVAPRPGQSATFRNAPKGGGAAKPGAYGTTTPPKMPTPAGAASTATPAAPGNPAPSPFLTPAQQMALSRYDRAYSDKMAALDRASGDRTATTNQQLAAAQHGHDVNTDTANQVMAARGLFQSSIRAADLNDLDSTLAQRNNILNTALGTFVTGARRQETSATDDWVTTHSGYNDLAVQNANGVTPAPDPATTPPAPAGSPTPAAGTAPKPITTHGSTTQRAPSPTVNLGDSVAKPQLSGQTPKVAGMPKNPRFRNGSPGGVRSNGSPAYGVASAFSGVGVPR